MNNAQDPNHVVINNSHFAETQDFEVVVLEIQHLNKMEKQSGKPTLSLLLSS